MVTIASFEKILVHQRNNFLLSVFERESKTFMLKTDFFEGDASSYLSTLPKNLGVRSMEEGKDYHFIDTVFLLGAAPSDLAPRFSRDVPVISVHRNYSKLVLKLIQDKDNEKMGSEKILRVSQDITRLK